MQSMTGYGKGVSSGDGKTVTIELKTVNHRYLDLNVKLPKGFLFLEDAVKKRVASKLSRGHVDLYLNYERSAGSCDSFIADVHLAEKYLDAAGKLLAATGLPNDMTLSALLKVPDVVTRSTEPEDEKLLERLTLSALDIALEGLNAMRRAEGSSLKADLASKLDNIEASLNVIVGFAPSVSADYRAKLNARMAEVVPKDKIDEARLATEVALYADRSSIDEEITRLGAHIVNMRRLLDSSEPCGRRLDFLVQEMNRETNTIGSKANELKITAEVLNIKNEIEKIREQAQNVE